MTVWIKIKNSLLCGVIERGRQRKREKERETPTWSSEYRGVSRVALMMTAASFKGSTQALTFLQVQTDEDRLLCAATLKRPGADTLSLDLLWVLNTDYI